jgi:hypothetical protein
LWILWNYLCQHFSPSILELGFYFKENSPLITNPQPLQSQTPDLILLLSPPELLKRVINGSSMVRRCLSQTAIWPTGSFYLPSIISRPPFLQKLNYFEIWWWEAVLRKVLRMDPSYFVTLQRLKLTAQVGA